MKKRMVFSFALFSILISIFCKLYYITIVIIFTETILVVFLSLKRKISFNWRKSPNLLDDNTRNYPYMELGYKRIMRNGSLDLTQKYSNLYSDFLILKRFYSLVKKDGTIIINLNPTKYYMFHTKPSIFSLNMLHPVTLLELGKIYYLYEIVFGEILNPALFILKETGIQANKKYVSIKYNEKMMKEIDDFCSRRNLKVEWYILGEKLEL